MDRYILTQEIKLLPQRLALCGFDSTRAMIKNSELFRHENEYPDFQTELATERLRQAIRYKTISYLDITRIDYGEFDAMHAFLAESYPHIQKEASWEKIGHSLLITLEGYEKDLKPALFMAHQDVVPVVEGTEKNWRHGPFSGDLSDGFIWGRGAMDIKQMLIAEMEALEYCLARGTRPARTIILAFGEDEETCSSGARNISDLLDKRGITLEYVLDEGAGEVSDATDWGAPGVLICPIGMYEKGYADMRLSVKSQGGHSSNPFHGTSLGKLSEAISDIIRHPTEARLAESVRKSLKMLSAAITEYPMKKWAERPELFEKEILEWFDHHESLYHLTRTTIAPTMISPGSPAGNVMPQDMSAVINFRLIPQDTPENLMRHFRRIVSKDIDLSWEQKISASVPSETESLGFQRLKDVLEHFFDRLIFLPAQNRGATDARQYEKICRCVMRFGPFLEEEDISEEGIHGTNERISVRAFVQGIRVLIRMMEQTCFSMGEIA